MSEAQLVRVVEDSALDGSWNAAAWLLERRWPERWALSKLARPPVEAHRAPKREGDEFARVIELAKRSGERHTRPS